MHPHVWQRQKQTAPGRFPPQFTELVLKTEKPFIQAITDLESPHYPSEIARLMNGNAIIVGDALAGFRLHTVASTTVVFPRASAARGIWRTCQLE